MAEAVEVLAMVEDRSQLDVFYDIRGAGADVIKVRSTNGLADHPLSLRQSATLMEDTYKMLAASARAAERPQAAYRGSASSKVTNFLNSVQPLPGYHGYGLTVHCPMPPEIGRQADMGDDFHMPFPRQATYKLAEALDYTTKAIETAIANDTLDNFKESVGQGISSNLCASVSELAKRGQGVVIDLDWAGVRPSAIPDSQFQFSRDSADILNQASRALSRDAPSFDEEIVAQVVKLEREEKEFDGRATLVSTWDGQTVRLSVEFEEAVYSTVIDAFRDHADISLMGDIHPLGNGYKLLNPRRVLFAAGE